MPGHRSITEAEKLAEARLGGIPLQHAQMTLVANIYRAASAVRQHLENSVLRGVDLTWTAFVVLWVVWVWGEPETRHVAEEAGISKGTLTGVVRTLERCGLVRRAGHPTDGRLVLLSLTDEGEELMRRVFPAFNEEEAFVTGQLSDEQCYSVAARLRQVALQVEEKGEARRLTLLGGAAPAPRRSGRRRKA
ncbi:MarR family winged helix-turn-helix transcriptional regulator [Streptomyces scabiei]|uniref:MarR family winged helix-turn-helix transcriptional regulator n=1 Tax=Streptomyces scabiei TaxID=1930 RepID=UPI0029AE3BA6|nr:MarR family winged helix-turn-helix transcriptional regulator [Streptomyces scabiei]MDX3524640.1 MarR family winged helix-turn-helix transcriptional regulator [Streptomyces scabiei]